MSKIRKNYAANFKSKVALAAIREDAPISELCSQFGIHSSVLHRWKREALQGMEDCFKDTTKKTQQDHECEIKNLHAKIGELTVEKDFLEQASKALGLGGVKK